MASAKRSWGNQSAAMNMFFHFAIHVMEMLCADFEEKQCLFEDRSPTRAIPFLREPPIHTSEHTLPFKVITYLPQTQKAAK